MARRRALPVPESEAERDQVVAALRHHYAAGRLSLEAFTARVDQAYAAETQEDLRGTLRGLSAAPLAAGARTPLAVALRHEAFLIASAVFGVIEVFLVAVWALAGGGYFWPIWPALVILFLLSLVVVGLTAEAAQKQRRRRLGR